MLKVIRQLVIASILFYPATLRGQNSPSLNLDDLVSEALQNNPQLRSARNGTAAARTKGNQVTSWDAPQIGVEFYQTPIQSFPNPIKNGMETDYFVQQIIPFPESSRQWGKPQKIVRA